MKGIFNMFTKFQTGNKNKCKTEDVFYKQILILPHLLFSRYPYIPEVKPLLTLKLQNL